VHAQAGLSVDADGGTVTLDECAVSDCLVGVELWKNHHGICHGRIDLHNTVVERCLDGALVARQSFKEVPDERPRVRRQLTAAFELRCESHIIAIHMRKLCSNPRHHF
jgi:hypothetical protein